MSFIIKNIGEIPDFVIDAMARAILPAIRQYLKTEKGKEEYQKWIQDRKQLNKEPSNE